MIPLKLQLKNFLSYGQNLQTVDFTPYPLICLSGKNGHGKSALLDAITWAIWGQARKISGTAKADSHLMRLGQHHMLVIFDFEFNSQHYRIRREYVVTTGKQYASLDFGLIQGDKSTSLTSKTIRDTQAIIETTLGLDFESFINSAFLRQGQSNEFSKKSPKERKDILGTILGLNHYELLRRHALDKAKHASIETVHLNKFQEKLAEELHKIPELTITLTAVNQKIEHTLQQEKTIISQKDDLEKQKEQFAIQKNQQQLIVMTYDQRTLEEQKLLEELKEHHRTWKIIHRKYIHYTPLINLEMQKQTILEQINNHQTQVQKNLELQGKLLSRKQQKQQCATLINEEHQKIGQEIQLRVKSLSTELENKNKQIQDLERQQKNLAMELNQHQKEIESSSLELKSYEVNTAYVQNQETQFEKRKRFYHQWVAQANLIKTEKDGLDQKQELIHDENNPSCPLCEQNLSASRKKFLKTKFAHQDQFFNHRYTRLSHCIKNLKELLMEQHALLEGLKKKIEQHKILTIKGEELYKGAQKLQGTQKDFDQQHTSLSNELTELYKNFSDSQERLNQHQAKEATLFTMHPEYQKMQHECETLESQLEKSTCNQQAYQMLLDQLTLLEQQRTKAHEVQQELQLHQERKNRINELCNLLRALKKAKDELKVVLKGFEYLDNQMHALNNKEAALQITIHKLQEEKEILLQQKGSFDNELLVLKQKEKEFTSQQAKIKELSSLVDDYQTIAHAVSKDGIQALIIEDALPEIEQEANAILGQLTDNQAHIIIESLRDLKKGGSKETLDIKISDAIGIRPYELFSGGEAFRIDFSLRLAISKLLARRAGTSLQTLIIDEGFGSQDEEGLSHIMDALYKIQNNFCKIIIVSHLPSMKDQFPVHFFIEKGSQGSTVRVIEQG